MGFEAESWVPDFSSPKSIWKAYRQGYMGAVCDPEETAALLAALKTPLFGPCAYKLYGAGEGKLSMPFKSLLKFDPKFGPLEAQTTGDCVSHATRNAVDITRAVEIDIKGEAESFEGRGATEGIYQSRPWSGEGMTCSGAAKYINSEGGLLIRKDYGAVDLSVYNSSLGSSKRIPFSVYATEAKKHQVKTISMITTLEEARDAIANGYSISVCSDVGFSSKRDSKGIAERSGNWNHAMAWIACDDTRERSNGLLFLVQNSWGLWNSGPRVHGQPEGSFWIKESPARAMLAQQGSWVFSDVEGFPARDLPDYGTASYL